MRHLCCSTNTAGSDIVSEQREDRGHHMEARTSRPKIQFDITDPEKLLSTKYESLDYDITENKIYQREEQTRKAFHVYKVQAARWFVALIIGIITGLIASFIDFMVETISNFKYTTIKNSVDQCVSDDCLFVPMLIWWGFNGALVLVASFLVAFIEPCAAGSGIPQIKCYLNGVKVPRVVRIKTLIAKVIGVICSVSGGLAVGKEGPMIHSGAVVAAGVSQGRSTSLGLDLRIFEYFHTDTEKRDFVSGGAAAGVAAAFGAPVGGLLFSLEEGASFWNQNLAWRAFFCSMVSTFTLNIVQSYIKNTPWDLSSPGLINFGTFENLGYNGVEIIIIMFVGLLGGLFGAIFIFMNHKISLFRSRYLYPRWAQVMEAILVALVTASFGFISIIVNKDCKPMIESKDEMKVQFFCPDGYYSSSTNLFFDTPEASVKKLFHQPIGSFDAATLASYTIGYFLLACWTYGLSVPSGLFIPSLLIGAAWGRLFGIGLQTVFPNSNWADPGKYALIAAASQLGGIVRMTISLTVIMMEATGNISLGLPIMLALICAKWCGDYVGSKLGCGHGIYDMHIQMASVPILDWEPPHLSERIHAPTVMSHPVAVFRLRETVGYIVDVLKKEIHNGFPVVDRYDREAAPVYEHIDLGFLSEEMRRFYLAQQLSQSDQLEGSLGQSGRSTEGRKLTLRTFGRYRGMILRHQLIMLLKLKVWTNNPDVEKLYKRLKMSDFRDAYPRYPPIHHISISPVERDYIVDLEPFMNRAPYTVHVTASLPRIFRLFRGLGLRHLVVVNVDNKVMGMLTRKDISRYRNMTDKEGKLAVKELHLSR